MVARFWGRMLWRCAALGDQRAPPHAAPSIAVGGRELGATLVGSSRAWRTGWRWPRQQGQAPLQGCRLAEGHPPRATGQQGHGAGLQQGRRGRWHRRWWPGVAAGRCWGSRLVIAVPGVAGGQQGGAPGRGWPGGAGDRGDRWQRLAKSVVGNSGHGLKGFQGQGSWGAARPCP